MRPSDVNAREVVVREVIARIKAENVKFVDLLFTCTRGQGRHVSIPVVHVDEDFFKYGKMFDGSSIGGWQVINESDLILLPDPSTALIDPFYEEKTMMIRCNVIDPTTMKGYSRDPRTVAQRTMEYLRSTGIADECYFGPEPEFFIFDDVRFKNSMEESSFRIDAHEAAWNTGREFADGNNGHRTMVKGGYFPVAPVDPSQDLRSAMCLVMNELGIKPEAHHHEVATCQGEISTEYRSLLAKADEVMLIKYVIHNVAHSFGKTATFMPKPLVGDNGSGMHCHVSLAKNGRNLFQGDDSAYAGLSDTALHFIGGVIKHTKALNAFTNPSTNSYKRLVPGYEAPVILAYSARNRSAAIRLPLVSNPKARRIEIRYPDPMANPYLAFSAICLAGLDGIQKKIHPGNPMDVNLYHLDHATASDLPTVCYSLEQALDSLDKDREFLLVGDVFSNASIDAYIQLLSVDVDRIRTTTHPLEFEMYYSL